MSQRLVEVLNEIAREKYAAGQACCGGQAHWLSLRLQEALAELTGDVSDGPAPA
jgi:hypothetical protein